MRIDPDGEATAGDDALAEARPPVEGNARCQRHRLLGWSGERLFDRPSRCLTGREDRDLMVADWGIHHLHLSSEIDSDGFVKRGGDLLFAAFGADDAYLIGIYQHLTDWARKEVLGDRRPQLADRWNHAGDQRDRAHEPVR